MVVKARNTITLSRVDDGKTSYVHPAYLMPDGTFTKVLPGENLLTSNPNHEKTDKNDAGKPALNVSYTEDMVEQVKDKYIFLSIDYSVKNAQKLPDGTIRVVYEISFDTTDTAKPVNYYAVDQRFTIGQTVEGRAEKKFKISDNITRVRSSAVHIQCNGDYIQITNPKLEIVDENTEHSTPYTPSPQDDPVNAYPAKEGTYSDFNPTGSDNPDDYVWKPFRGIPGVDGVGIKSTAVTYALADSGTTAPTTGWTATVPALTKGRYLWTKSVWTYTDNSTETGYSVTYVAKDGNDGHDGIAGKDGVGIKSTKIEYAKNTNGTTAPTSGWSTTVPSTNPGDYIWTKTTWTYDDDTTESGYSVGRVGTNGSNGSNGQNAVVGYLTNESITLPSNSGGTVSSFASAKGEFKLYDGLVLVTSGATFTKVSDAGLTSSISSKGAYSITAMSADSGEAVYKAVYKGVEIIKTVSVAKSKAGTNGTNGQDGKDGQPGKDGTGIKSTTVVYQLSDSGTVAPSGTWTAEVPSLTKGKYLWTKTVWTYTDNSTENGFSVSYISKDGSTGADGKPGKDGTGIKSTAVTYQVGDSGTTQPTGSWVASVPSLTKGKYLWTKTVWTYTDNSTEAGYSVAYIAKDGENGANGQNAVNYYLTLSSQILSLPRGASAFTPGNIIINAYSQTGSAAPVVYTGRIVVEEIASDGSTVSKNNSDVATFTYTPTNINIKSATAKLYLKGATTTLLDQMSIAVVRDGTNGSNGTNGASSYTWVRYSIAANGNPMVATPTATTKYVGFAVTTTNTVPTYDKFTWSKYQGEDGVAGKDGVGLKSTNIQYAQSTSGTTAPTTGWATSVPTLVKGQYLWTKTVWTYTDNSNETGYTVSYNAKDGNNGSDGIAGKDGVGITDTAIAYAGSTSGTAKPTTGWAATIPTVAEGNFLWTRTTWIYSDGTTETGYSVAKMGPKGDKGDTGAKGPQGDKGATGPKGDPTGVTESKTAPTSPYTGMLWRDISTSTPLLKKWDGKAWVIFELYAENLKVDSLDAVAAKVGTLESSFTDEKLIWLEADSSRENSKASGTQVFTKGLMDLDYTFSFSETGWSSSGSGSSTYGYNGLDVNIKEKWIGDSGTSDITRRATFNEAGEEFHSTATDGKIEWRYSSRADPRSINFSSIITTKATGKKAITGIEVGPSMGIAAQDAAGRKELSLTQIKGLADPKYMYAKVFSSVVSNSAYPRDENVFTLGPAGKIEYVYLVWRMYDSDTAPTRWYGYSAVTEIPLVFIEESLPMVFDQILSYQINGDGNLTQVVAKQVQLYKSGANIALRGTARNAQGKQKWWGLEKIYTKWFNV